MASLHNCGMFVHALFSSWRTCLRRRCCAIGSRPVSQAGRTDVPRGSTTDPSGGKLALLSAATGSVIGSAKSVAAMVTESRDGGTEDGLEGDASSFGRVKVSLQPVCSVYTKLNVRVSC